VDRLGYEALQAHLGGRFATIHGQWDDSSIVLPDDTEGMPVAVLWAGGPCSLTIGWLDHLARSNWTLEGYDRVVVLTLRQRPPEVLSRVPDGVEIYEVDFPLPGYLVYVYWYPTMFYVDSTGVLEGYQVGPTNEVVRRSDG